MQSLFHTLESRDPSIRRSSRRKVDPSFRWGSRLAATTSMNSGAAERTEFAKAGDRRCRVDRQQPGEFGARLGQAPEVRIGRDFASARGIIPRLVVQSAIGSLDRLFEASREEMNDAGTTAKKKPSGSNGLERGARSHASIAGSDWLRNAWRVALATQAVGRAAGKAGIFT